MVKDLTKGNPTKLILQVAIPLLFGNLFQKFYNMADTIIIGQILGKESLAAVGSTGSLNFLIIGFVQGICIGFSIPIAQRFGAGDHENLRRHVANAVWLGAGLTIVLTAVTVAACRPILTLMQTPENIFEEAHAYLSVIFMGIGVSYSVVTYIIALVFGTDIARLFIDVSETALLDQVRHYLSINCFFYFMLAILLILRNTLQGLDVALPAMSAGICEMVARSVIAFGLVGRYGFNAACCANAAAWIAANLLLVPTYIVTMRRLRREYSDTPKEQLKGAE